MLVKAWTNGDHSPDGNGYGVKVDPRDRDRFFKRTWGTILLELEGETMPVEINIDKDSFWNTTCRELISVRIGKWMIQNHFAPWLRGQPPVLSLVPIQERRFRLTKQGKGNP